MNLLDPQMCISGQCKSNDFKSCLSQYPKSPGICFGHYMSFVDGSACKKGLKWIDTDTKTGDLKFIDTAC